MNRIQLMNRYRERRRLHYEECRRDLGVFFRGSWDVLERIPLKENWHQDLVAEHLMACKAGQIHRLILNLPPRFTKSLMASVAFPAWVWASAPEERFMFLSYAQSLATQHSTDRRTLIESQWYQVGWGHKYDLATDQNVKTFFQNNHRGRMIATSVTGSATGFGGKWLIVDDPHDVKKVESEVTRRASLESFDRKFRNRLDDPATGVIIIVMQRSHEGDLTGHVLAAEGSTEDGGPWVHVKVPNEAPEKTTIIFPISGRVVTRDPQELLHEDRLGRSASDALKKGLGSYGYSGQYNQSPSPAGGGVIKEEWWRYWKNLPPRFDDKLISADTAFKDDEESSYVCFQAWGNKGADSYLLDEMRGHMNFPATVRNFEAFCKRHPDILTKLVEDKANGPAMIATLRDKIPGIIPVQVERDKVARARGVSPMIEAGNVHLPDPELNPWVRDFISECSSFPKSRVNDRVDTMTQALARFQRSAGEYGEDLVPKGKSTMATGLRSGDAW